MQTMIGNIAIMQSSSYAAFQQIGDFPGMYGTRNIASKSADPIQNAPRDLRFGLYLRARSIPRQYGNSMRKNPPMKL